METNGNSKKNLILVKDQIINALTHPEADEGLYFRNFAHLHEEDDRPPVIADDVSIIKALEQLIDEGKVVVESPGEDAIFRLA